MNRFLRTLNENRSIIAKTVFRDLSICAMITASIFAAARLFGVDLHVNAIDVFRDISTLWLTGTCIIAVSRHKRAYYGTIEKREDMSDRTWAQVHVIFKRLTSMLAVGAIVLLGVIWGLLHGLAQYLLTIVR